MILTEIHTHYYYRQTHTRSSLLSALDSCMTESSPSNVIVFMMSERTIHLYLMSVLSLHFQLLAEVIYPQWKIHQSHKPSHRGLVWLNTETDFKIYGFCMQDRISSQQQTEALHILYCISTPTSVIFPHSGRFKHNTNSNYYIFSYTYKTTNISPKAYNARVYTKSNHYHLSNSHSSNGNHNK